MGFVQYFYLKTVMLLTKLYIVKKNEKNKWQVVWKTTKSPMSSIKICIDSCALAFSLANIIVAMHDQ